MYHTTNKKHLKMKFFFITVNYCPWLTADTLTNSLYKKKKTNELASSIIWIEHSIESFKRATAHKRVNQFGRHWKPTSLQRRSAKPPHHRRGNPRLIAPQLAHAPVSMCQHFPRKYSPKFIYLFYQDAANGQSMSGAPSKLSRATRRSASLRNSAASSQVNMEMTQRFEASSASTPAGEKTPTNSAASGTPTDQTPRKSNWEVIEHFNKPQKSSQPTVSVI